MAYNIDMIGLVHNDARSDKRLRRAFKRLQPDVIAVEYAGPGFDEFMQNEAAQEIKRVVEKAQEEVMKEFGMGHNKLLTAHLAKSNGGSVYGQEIPTVKAYSQETGIPYIPIDSLEIVLAIQLQMMSIGVEEIKNNMRQQLRQMEENDMLYQLETEEDIIRFADQNYILLEHHIKKTRHKDPKLEAYVKQMIMSGKGIIGDERDKYQAEKVLEAADKYGKVVHVGGYGHITDVPEAPTLYTLVKDRVNMRYSLRKFDSTDFLSPSGESLGEDF